ncbi:716_t:CDS:2, partial [Ambispora leptoticha]
MADTNASVTDPTSRIHEPLSKKTHPVTESEEPNKKLLRLLTEEYRAHPLPDASSKEH